LFTGFLLDPHTFTASVGQNAGYAGDKDSATYWSTGTVQAANQSFTIGLGLIKNWGHIRLDMGSMPYDYPYAYKVLTSDDGVTWSQIATGMGTPFITDIWVNAQLSKWIRLALDEPPAGLNYPWTIAEITVDNATAP
jgi:hypothetical protein